jgi:hypothetical protein
MSIKPIVPRMSASAIGLSAFVALGAAGCGVEQTPQPPPYPQPITNPNPNPDPTSPSSQCPPQCPGSCNAAGECLAAARQCPEACPDDCDSFGQCNYVLDPDARYRVDLIQASVTQSGTRSCSITGLLGASRQSCDLYVVFRTSNREIRGPVQRDTHVVYGGVTLPDARLGDLESSFEVRIMDENTLGGGMDMLIASCVPDWTREALEIGTISIQCGNFGDFDTGDAYSGSSLAVVQLRVRPLDGGGVKRADGTNPI